ncbi:MAG TPA: hypothetical protein VIJ31_03615 [Acidothermaceae bacterium]
MRLNTLAATAIVAVLALGATACKSGSHASGGAAPASNPPATQTQADSPSTEASSSASIAASTAASASASTPPSASSSAAATSAPSAAATSAPAAAAAGEINACSLMTGAQASSLTGRQYGAGTASTIAKGQDMCDYPYSGPSIALDVIVYGPSSGVGWATANAVLAGVGPVTQVSGVGDKAIFAGIELDIQTGKWIIAIQGADKLNQDTGAIAIGKVLVAALASK